MNITIYTHTDELPQLSSANYFHSPELMALYEQTPRHRPYMAVATDADGQVVAHMLAVERYHRPALLFSLARQARILGEGVYLGDPDNGTRNMIFSAMLDALTHRLQQRVLYVEVSHLSKKMFGYAPLRAAGFFPVKWMNVHNSLHSLSPEERIMPRQQRHVSYSEKQGCHFKAVETEADFQAFSRLLRHHNWLKPRRYIPNDAFFRGMLQTGHCRMFLTTYRQHVIGCSLYVFTDGDAYLWYSAARRKSFATLHPNAFTFWNTIRYAYQEGCQHIRFMDVGLPFRRHPYRDFILSFGGKEVSTFRWFRISIRWVNRLASWLWKE